MEPLISLVLCDLPAVYHPGEVLTYEYQIDAIEKDEIQAIEDSVLWYSEGKGERDMGVHAFHRSVPADIEGGDLRPLCRQSVRLPRCPLSYSGVIVKIRWCVRVRVFLGRGKECSYEVPFDLGNIPVARSTDEQPTSQSTADATAG
jgi:hypothetical protein